MPQKSTRSPGARTSGMAHSGCFGLGELVRVTGVEEFLETHAEGFAFEPQLPSAAAPLEPHAPKPVVRAAGTPGVALSLAGGTPKPQGDTFRRSPDDSCHS